MYVSVSYSLILPWTHTCKLIERWHFSGTMWMMIKGILKSWCWISQYQGTFSILCSRIQGYMLSLLNEVDSYLLLLLCVLYDMQNQFLQQLVSKRSSISCLYNMWLSFRIKEKSFSWCFYFLQYSFYIIVSLNPYAMFYKWDIYIYIYIVFSFSKWTMVYLLVTVSTLLVFVLVRYTVNVYKG